MRGSGGLTLERKQELDTQGWDAISETFGRLYPEQDEPLHFGTLISWQLGGNDPLEGISVYDGGGIAGAGAVFL